MMNDQEFVELLSRLCSLGPYSDHTAAERGLFAAVRVIARALTQDERLALAEDLRPELAQVLRSSAENAPTDLPALVQALASAEQLTAGVAHEHLLVVARALAALSPHGRFLLTRALPELAPHLGPFEHRDAKLAPHGLPPVGAHDLAEGHEGGKHPLSGSDPALLAHRHSVARSSDPHGDTKLSSAQGLSQERDGTSLATGQPGSRRPLASRH